MEEWMHCNVCYKRWGCNDLSQPLRFTSCKHIYCNDCSRKCESENICPYCKNKCNAFVLNSKIPPSIEQLFKPPENFVKHTADMLKRMAEISHFHKSQRIHLLQYLVKKVEQQTKIIKMAEERLLKFSRDVKSVTKENNELKKYIKSLPHHRFNGAVSSNHGPTSPIIQSPNFISGAGDNNYRNKQEFLGTKSVPITPNKNHKVAHMRVCETPNENMRGYSTYNGRLRLQSPPVNGRLVSASSMETRVQQGLNTSFGHGKNAISPHIVISPLVRNQYHHGNNVQSNLVNESAGATPITTPRVSPYVRSSNYKRSIFPKQ